VRSPIRFRPYLRPMVWGGRRLGEALNKPLPGEGPYGESWDVSDHPSHRSVVADGPFAGRTLTDLLSTHAEALLGRPANAFPWLVKHLDARDWLSVQVHPDEASVGRLWPGENSKNEAWFVLDARPGSKVYAGLLPGVDEQVLRRKVADGTCAECLHRFDPQPGDCLYLPAGTVHAVGGGVLMAEVQQSSDATFRLFDWNRVDEQGRSRELHVDKAMACIDWKQGPVHPVPALGYPQHGEAPAGAVRQQLVSCPYFRLVYARDTAPFDPGAPGVMRVAIVLHGRGELVAADGRFALAPGETLLLPARMAAAECRPQGPLGLLLAELPA
jgi:mannose-6-phosphate isomerase